MTTYTKESCDNPICSCPYEPNKGFRCAAPHLIKPKYRADLYKLLPDNPVTVELGVAEGLFSRDILQEWKPKLHYLVDLWETTQLPGDVSSDQPWHDSNYQNVLKLLEPFTNYKILRGLTVQMSGHVPDNSVDLVYVDACHSYECVRDDINAWWDKVKSGGIFAFHDFEMSHYGVKQAVTEFAAKRNLIVTSIPENSIQDAGAFFYKP